ncbi:MAG TPA: hypothetical protein VH333_15920, partial [Pseudonocardiaceae bacterium]|nr:hypothetical protein [Pseudonocardiaceae bacterium]
MDGTDQVDAIFPSAAAQTAELSKSVFLDLAKSSVKASIFPSAAAQTAELSKSVFLDLAKSSVKAS